MVHSSLITSYGWGLLLGILLSSSTQQNRPVHAAASATNWALGRPTDQSSQYGTGYPYNAVDGNTGGHYYNDGCTHTTSGGGENNPWWVVDLGQPITVTSVTVFNRVGCTSSCEERLHDYDIGLTDVDPSTQAPSPGGYDLCHHVDGIAPVSASYTCDSFTRGRYLVIQIPGDNEILTLCEVQVYGDRRCPTSGRPTEFSFVLHSKDARPTTDLVGVGCTVFIQEDCALKCAENADCWSFSYQPLTGECILTSVWAAGGDTYTTVHENGVILYSMKDCETI